MTENERQKMMILADTINGEINRMCVTKDLAELDAMALCAQGNIERLLSMRYSDFEEHKQEKSCNTCNNYDKQNGCVGTYDYMCECANNNYKHWTPYKCGNSEYLGGELYQGEFESR